MGLREFKGSLEFEGGSGLDWSLGDQGWARGLGLSPGVGSGVRVQAWVGVWNTVGVWVWAPGRPGSEVGAGSGLGVWARGTAGASPLQI